MFKHSRTVSAIAAASLLAAFAAQANKGAEYKSEHHNKEHHKNFFITGGATYLEPSLNSLNYLDVEVVSGTSEFVTTEAIQPEFNWGYYLAAGYRISHHYDVQASWSQFNQTLTDSTFVEGAAGTTVYTSNHDYELLTAGDTLTADSSQTIDYSQFDATLGQFHDITEMLRARLFTGIRYAKVDTDTDNFYYFSSPSTPLMDAYDSTFSGWGPEVGVNLEYKIYKQFGVVAEFAAALLIGQQTTESELTDVTTAYVDTDSVTRMVPTVDAKLGLNWLSVYEFEGFGFGLEAGYEATYLLDAVDQAHYDTIAGVMHKYSNYGNMGPYLNVTAAF